jgi:hypothetical protein
MTNLTNDGEVVATTMELRKTGDFKSWPTWWLGGGEVLLEGKLGKCLSLVVAFGRRWKVMARFVWRSAHAWWSSGAGRGGSKTGQGRGRSSARTAAGSRRDRPRRQGAGVAIYALLHRNDATRKRGRG